MKGLRKDPGKFKDIIRLRSVVITLVLLFARRLNENSTTWQYIIKGKDFILHPGKVPGRLQGNHSKACRGRTCKLQMWRLKPQPRLNPGVFLLRGNITIYDCWNLNGKHIITKINEIMSNTHCAPSKLAKSKIWKNYRNVLNRKTIVTFSKLWKGKDYFLEMHWYHDFKAQFILITSVSPSCSIRSNTSIGPFSSVFF